MSKMMLQAGWGWPAQSRKSHYFPDGEAISLCRKWMYTGPRDNESFESSDDCAACRRKLTTGPQNGKRD